MSRFYNQNHVVFGDLKKHITINVHQACPSSNQGEKSLDISLTDENDLYFLYTAKIYASDFHRIKEEQGILVEYNAFGQMLTDLLTKCLREEANHPPRYILTFSESCEPHVLQIVETTDFRRLTHLAIHFVAASDEALKSYLVSYIKKSKANFEVSLEKCKHAESNLIQQLAASNKISSELNDQMHSLTESHKDELSALKQRYDTQLELIKSSNEGTIKHLTSRHMAEIQNLKETQSVQVNNLKAQLDTQSSKLTTINLREEEIKSQLSLLTKTLADTESRLLATRTENDALKSDILSLKVQAEQHQSTLSQLNTKSDCLESDFRVEQKRATCLESECAKQKEQLNVAQEDLLRKAKQLEKVEKLLKQQTGEVTKANSVIRQLQKDLKNSQNKAKMRGHVATEQEKVLTAREADLEEVQVTVRELTESLEIEKAKRLENGTEVTRLQLALADAKKTIENNENIISWLNRQITESYTSSWHQRLKSTGIPIVPSYMSDKQPPPLLSQMSGEQPSNKTTALAALPDFISDRVPSTNATIAQCSRPFGSVPPLAAVSTTTSAAVIDGHNNGYDMRPPITSNNGLSPPSNGVVSAVRSYMPRTGGFILPTRAPKSVEKVPSSASHSATSKTPCLTGEMAGMSVRSPSKQDRINPLLLPRGGAYQQPVLSMQSAALSSLTQPPSDFENSLSHQSDSVSRGGLFFDQNHSASFHHQTSQQEPSFVSSYFPQPTTN